MVSLALAFLSFFFPPLFFLSLPVLVYVYAKLYLRRGVGKKTHTHTDVFFFLF